MIAIKIDELLIYSYQLVENSRTENVCTVRMNVTRKKSKITLQCFFFLSFIQISKVQIKLIGPVVDDFISDGIVQVEHEGKWGYICPTKWTRANSYVLCGHLGFPNAEESYAVIIQDEEPVYWLDQVKCKGLESSIVSCDHAGWGPHQCEGDIALRIKCVRRKITKVSDYVTATTTTTTTFFIDSH